MNFDGWLIARLTVHGAYGGVIDNVPGRQMTEALKRFQKATGLKVSGLADQATVDALRLAPSSGQPPALAPKLPAEPVWMREAFRFMGLREIAGSKSNPTILSWATSLGGWVASYFRDDDIPWCGLFIGHIIAATLPGEPLPANPLSALAWNKLGRSMSIPALGAVLVFRRDGGGHVGLYAGEDTTHYHVLGGNQRNSVSVTRVEKDRLAGVRWPTTGGNPVGARVILSASDLGVSRNEA